MAKWGEGDPRWIVEERQDSHNVNNWHWKEVGKISDFYRMRSIYNLSSDWLESALPRSYWLRGSFRKHQFEKLPESSDKK